MFHHTLPGRIRFTRMVNFFEQQGHFILAVIDFIHLTLYYPHFSILATRSFPTISEDVHLFFVHYVPTRVLGWSCCVSGAPR